MSFRMTLCNNCKRARAADTLKDYGRRVQKSVFECRLEARYLPELLAKLREITDNNVDNVLVYMLGEACVKQKNQWPSRSLKKPRIFLYYDI